MRLGIRIFVSPNLVKENLKKMPNLYWTTIQTTDCLFTFPGPLADNLFQVANMNVSMTHFETVDGSSEINVHF